MDYLFSESKCISPDELERLFAGVGWGRLTPSELQRSMDAYPLVVHARTPAGELVGYVSAFSDGVLSTMLGELVVHRSHRRKGVAAALLSRVEQRFPNAPVYIKALGEAKHFFIACGYQAPRGEMTVLFRKPASAPDSSTAPPFPEN